MHQDKTVARILLIFSVANVALAVPTVVRQRNPVTGGLDDESTDRSGSELMPELVSDSDLAPESLDDSPLESPTRSSHQDSLPASPAVYSYPNSVFDSSGTDSSGSIEEWESPGFHWPDFASIHNSAPGSPSGSSDHALAPPEPVTFFNDALKTKLKIYAGLGAVVGVSAGLVYEVHKLVKDTRSHGAEKAGRDLASNDPVSRGPGHGLPYHPQPRKDPVSRGLANLRPLRDEDLRLLSVLTRQAFDGLD